MQTSVSIALATYNGERYLQEQLDSIVAQTQHPDEVIICDDGSIDSTLGILRRFSRTAPFDVKIMVNEGRLGYSKNFEKALGLCSGRFIFLCDQDDVWFNCKVERVVSEFLSSPSVQVVVNDAKITNEWLEENGRTVFGHRGIVKDSSEIKLGCCMAIRREFLMWAMPVPSEAYGHDGWLAKLAYYLGVRKEIQSHLQYWRRHDKAFSSYRLRGAVLNRAPVTKRFYQGVQTHGLRKRLRRLLLLEKKICSTKSLPYKGARGVGVNNKLLERDLLFMKLRLAIRESKFFNRPFLAWRQRVNVARLKARQWLILFRDMFLN